MALQDQTLANTQAKMGLEASRRRLKQNAQATLASLSPGGPRRPAELPWWVQASRGGQTPSPGVSGARAGLQGLGGLMLGVAGRKAAESAQYSTDPIYADRETMTRAVEGVKNRLGSRTPAQLDRVPTSADFSRKESPFPPGMSPAQMSSLRVSLQTILEVEGLPGVERLVQLGRIPREILETLKGFQQDRSVPTAGQNGAPAGGGLPELGVVSPGLR